MHQPPQNWLATLIPIVIISLALFLRIRRMNRGRRLHLERLWILPSFYALVVAAIFWSHPPHGMTWLYAFLALLIGLPLGWYRGKLMHISVDPETHELSQRASPAAILLIFALVAIRMVARSYAASNGGGSPDAIFAVTDILLAFALGFLGAQRLEMALRARSLLQEARQARR